MHRLNHRKIEELEKIWEKKEIAFFKDCLNLRTVRHLRDSSILFQRTAPLKRILNFP